KRIKKKGLINFMNKNQPNNPLHGIKLADILEFLVEYYGWEVLGEKIKINSFNTNPSIKSSLTFLRKTPWAREKVEQLYLKTKRKEPIGKFVRNKSAISSSKTYKRT